jgi:hypothetical protein
MLIERHGILLQTMSEAQQLKNTSSSKHNPSQRVPEFAKLAPAKSDLSSCRSVLLVEEESQQVSHAVARGGVGANKAGTRSKVS